MLKRPRHSRWSRLPATFRSGEKQIPGPEADLERLTLYLPGGLLDRAESQARQAGVESVQRYCEMLLRRAIELTDQRPGPGEPISKGLRMEWLEEVASDPAYHAARTPADSPHDDADGPGTQVLAWSRPAGPEASESSASASGGSESPEGPAISEAPEAPDEGSAATETAALLVLRHAGLAGEFPEGLVPSLRRGEPVAPGPAQELLQALIDLEREFREAEFINRRLAFALHRLAFEGQLLITDAWPGVAPDPGTVETLRLVQEAVDRVLSGEDIRYFSADATEAHTIENDGAY